jgi:hypothetical protein
MKRVAEPSSCILRQRGIPLKMDKTERAWRKSMRVQLARAKPYTDSTQAPDQW